MVVSVDEKGATIAEKPEQCIGRRIDDRAYFSRAGGKVEEPLPVGDGI